MFFFFSFTTCLASLDTMKAKPQRGSFVNKHQHVCTQNTEEGDRSLVAGVTGGRKPLDLSAGNTTWVLWKDSAVNC